METTINLNKEVIKNIKKLSHYSSEQFEKDARDYISAIREGRMINSIGKVSKSGMSRTIKFLSCEKSETRFWYRQYYCLFICLGYKLARNSNDYFSIGGCGMDMIFHTNYSIIHDLKNMGFITKEECEKLYQQTPTTI